ncbi:MAG: hypothetical protein IMZ54_07790 [Acidobacteria bacterium]|nr:hypothetical protein [Acidobacteriota bacterium]
MTWKYFRQFELREALAHADAGGVAIHESGQLWRGKSTSHLLAGSRGQLMTAAEELGLKRAEYVQLEPRLHIDLFGAPLMLALQKCMADEGEERRCRSCGCTEARACPGGCYWFEPDLCSRCAGVL